MTRRAPRIGEVYQWKDGSIRLFTGIDEKAHSYEFGCLRVNEEEWPFESARLVNKPGSGDSDVNLLAASVQIGDSLDHIFDCDTIGKVADWKPIETRTIKECHGAETCAACIAMDDEIRRLRLLVEISEGNRRAAAKRAEEALAHSCNLEGRIVQVSRRADDLEAKLADAKRVAHLADEAYAKAFVGRRKAETKLEAIIAAMREDDEDEVPL